MPMQGNQQIASLPRVVPFRFDQNITLLRAVTGGDEHDIARLGRNPDAAGQIRGLAIILAAFAEGLGVLAIVVGLLAIFIQPA